MWNDILDALERYDTALLSGFDTNGFPFSVRCMPSADPGNRRLDIEFPQSSGIQPGKASLLMHSHNEELWDLAQFLVRGTLVRTSNGHYFVPASISGSPRPHKPLEAFRNLREMRARANAYLKRRGMDRPKVPWDDIKHLQDRAEQWRVARSAERDQ